MSAAPVVRVEDLAVHYKSRAIGGRVTRALDGVSLEIERGKVFGLLGPNGAGKTTLVKVLLGLVGGYRGRAELLGEPAGRPPVRRRVGYLPEAHRMPGYLTGRQVLELFGMLCGRERAWLRERIPGWLERVGIADAADRKVREYSKGMQQRLGLAQALIHEPEVVFLDEPTDGVDPVGRATVREIIAGLRASGTTVFLNSHLLMEVEQMCDDVVILHKGRILRQGALAELTRGTGALRIDVGRDVEDLRTKVAAIGEVLDSGPRHVEIVTDDEGVWRVLDLLRAEHAPVRSIAPRRLTLEQVFIELVSAEPKS